MAGGFVILACLILIVCPSVAVTEMRMDSRTLHPDENALYRKSCGACHVLYQPGLLPERSWLKIVDTPGAHAGGTVSFPWERRKSLKRYLAAHSAERSRAPLSRKILDSLDSAETPLRISDVPYIRDRHKGIPDDMFKRPSVRFRGNCSACHPHAEEGIYAEHTLGPDR
jgi:mono/diheme cytochrome c family protein